MKRIILICSLVMAAVNLHAQDDCATAINVPTLDGTNCPSTAPSTTDQLANGACANGTFDTWFQFTAQGGTATIDVSSTQNGFRPEFYLISSSTNACGGTLTLEDCFDQNGNYTAISGVVTGLTPGNTYWVVVMSHNNTTSGITTVCIDNPVTVPGCVDNEDCTNAATITLNPSGGAASCVADCNNGATDGIDFVGNPCSEMNNPTVWYTITTDAAAATLDINLSSATDLSDPEFALFTDNGCVGGWTTVSCVEGTGGSAGATGIPIAPNTTYLIAVSDDSGDEGDFDLCITQNPDNSACNTNNALTVTSTSLGSPLAGPYLPGEVVNFCYNVIDFVQFNCNYIGAFVPSFGDCWDPASFDAQGMPVNVTTPLAVNGTVQNGTPFDPWSPCSGTASGSWSWFPAGSVTYNVNGYYAAGTPMPAGWYFLSSYDPFTGACAPDPTDPDNTFGDGNFPDCGTNTFDYTVCFSLIAGPQTNCTAGQTDCSVEMKTFADGEFGAWASIGCTVDGLTSFPAALNCALPVELASFDGEYIDGQSMLEWVTVSENNTSHFILSHAAAGADFQEIAKIDAHGTSLEEHTYRFVHETPANGVNYYNLKSVDHDGFIENKGFITLNANYGYAFYNSKVKQIILSSAANVEIYSTEGKLVATSRDTRNIPFTEVGVFIIRNMDTGETERIVVK